MWTSVSPWLWVAQEAEGELAQVRRQLAGAQEAGAYTRSQFHPT